MIGKFLPAVPKSRWAEPVGRAGFSGLLFLFAFLVGLAAFLAGPLLVHPNSGAAREALARLGQGSIAVGIEGLFAIGVLGVVMLCKPLLIMVSISAMEMIVCRRAMARGDIVRLLVVQSLFMTFGTMLALAVQELGLLPPPLISRPSVGLAWLTLEAVPLFLLGALITDLIGYWSHRAHHSIPLLWKFHAVHHSHDLDMLHNVVHPVERCVSFVLVSIPPGLLFGISGEQLFVLAVLLSLHDVFTHTVLPFHFGPLRWLFCDNRTHFVHHSRNPEDYNKNFAARFPVIDMMFGTYRKPPAGGLCATGLADRTAPATLGQYLTAQLPHRAAATAG
jgi:sterol desaturase/sphingolipid hydroxylase (fatty acid hydroxylase superfamily)